MPQLQTQNFNIELGLLRIISACMVLTIHASDVYIYHENSIAKHFFMLLKSFVVFAVPIFVMMTGYLVAQRVTNLKYKYLKNFLMMIFIPLFYYNAIYLILPHTGLFFIDWKALKLLDFLMPWYGKLSYGFLWYFVSIIPIYILFLFINFKVPTTKKEYLLGGVILGALIIFLQIPNSVLIPNWIWIYAFGGIYIIQPLIQYKQRFQKYNIIFFFIYMLSALYIYMMGVKSGITSLEFFVITFSFVAFVLTLPIKKYPERRASMIKKLSNMTLSFYGLHIVGLIIAIKLVSHISIMISLPVVIQGIIMLGLSFVLTFIFTIIEQLILNQVIFPIVTKCDCSALIYRANFK